MAKARNIKRAVGTALVVLVALSLAGFGWLWFAPCWAGGCAPLQDLAEYQAEGSELLDVDGKPFGTLASVNRKVVSLDSLPEFLPQAFVAVEDQRFYDHGGVDFWRVMGAAVRNVKAGGVAEGGSTITMQLARNLFPEWLPYTERSPRRKLMEVRVARQIERSFSKEKILELYLNHIYLGSGAYGVEAASRAYFGKPASELTLPEAATLGGLPKAPSHLNPIDNRKGARERRDLVLGQMVDAGYITAEQAQEAQAEPIRLVRGGGAEKGMRGSYFVERVRREMEEMIGSRFYTAGLKIYTTLDPTAQRAAEEELIRQLDAVEAGQYGAFRHATYPESKGKSAETGTTPYLQGAVVLLDAQSGEVRALVGGRDFEDSKFDRAVQAQRQPGSAFKPFVYLAGLERYGSPSKVMEDAPVRLTLSGGKVWEPRNYTGTYDGPLTLREALTRSKNTVTVRVAQDVGMRSVIDAARTLGITSEIPDVPSAALGSAEVRPIELIAAYAPLANGGRRVDPHFIRRIVDRHGQVVWESGSSGEEVLDPAVAFVLTSMLEDVVNRGTGTQARTAGYRGPAAGKTGTTNSATDVWFVGYTPDLVGGVWMGLDDPKTIVRGASGGTLAAPVWGRIMQRVYAGRPTPAPWARPAGVAEETVELGTGMLVGESCPPRGPTYTEYFLGSAPPAASCAPTIPYPAYTSLDTAWVDEEWATTDVYADTLLSPPTGVDWPELERMRDRMGTQTGSPAMAMDSIYGPPPVRPAPGQPAPAQRPAPRETPRPAQPERAEPAPPEPRVLGTPTTPDTAAAPPDTTGVGRR